MARALKSPTYEDSPPVPPCGETEQGNAGGVNDYGGRCQEVMRE